VIDIFTSCVLCTTLTAGLCLECLDATSCSVCVNSSYLVNGSSLCVPCSAFLANCLDCSNSSYCTACLSGFYPSPAFGASYCLNCSLALPNCLTCLSSTNCTGCASTKYFLGVDHVCYPCADVHSLWHCFRCSVNTASAQYNCTLCDDGYFVDASNLNRCTLCSSAIGSCVACANASYCSQCDSTAFGFSQQSGGCVSCGVLFPNCQNCSNQQCTQCVSGLQLAPDGLSCQCAVGYYVS
jgi:hypothetical protein